MQKIKPQAVAGIFYPRDSKNNQELLNYFEQNNNYDYEYKTRAVIVPHAGWVYSGQLASEGIATLDKNVENVFIIAPAHRAYVENFVLTGYDAFETPYGAVRVNAQICQELYNNFDGKFNDEAYKSEHSIEVQLPILQKYLNNFKIVPILIGKCEIEVIKNIISHYYQNPKNAFLISSDLSHFYPLEEAKKLDFACASLIEKNQTNSFKDEFACNAPSILALLSYAADNNYSLIRVGMSNSAEKTGDRERVVGYGAWMLSEIDKNKFVAEYFAQYAKIICKRAIGAKLKGIELALEDLGHIPPVLEELGASFITLEMNGNLRGCIGSILAHRPLILDLIENAQKAAFEDPRFNPLSTEEFENVDISISLLSIPEKMNFQDEEDLIAQIVQGEDGIIIKEGNHQAVYLPSVWEHFSFKRDFLNSLKQKAGLSQYYFSDTFEAYRFRSEYIK